MAGVLRNLKLTMEPSGRVIRVRELVGGDPRRSRLVEVRLRCREDRSDIHNGWRPSDCPDRCRPQEADRVE